MKRFCGQLSRGYKTSLLLTKGSEFCKPCARGPWAAPSDRGFCTKQAQKGEPESSLPTPSTKESIPVPAEALKDGKLEPEVEARMEFYKMRKEILSIDESEYEGTMVSKPRDLNLAQVQEGVQANFLSRWKKEDPEWTLTDQNAFMRQDIDLRTEAIKRWWARLGEKYEIDQQRYNPQRNSVLGDDLAAAHFIVFRKGRVKLLGQDRWVDEYRVDAEEGQHEDDLPSMQFDLCTLPTAYDPRYLVEAIDASNIPLRYEGLDNLANLRYCKSLKLENCVHLEAWCLDKLAYMFSDRLEYLDLSGCTGLTEGSLCSLVRFTKLKTLVLRNLSQVRNMAVVCAILEDSNPNLEIIGVDYEKKLQELKEENEQLDRKARETEANTITVETTEGPEHSSLLTNK